PARRTGRWLHREAERRSDVQPSSGLRKADSPDRCDARGPVEEIVMRMLLLMLSVVALAQPSIVDAVMEGDAKTVAALIAAGADVNVKGNDGITPLMQAASAGRVDILRMLVAAKADVGARNAGGASALTAAAFSGYADAVQLLLANQADPDV